MDNRVRSGSILVIVAMFTLTVGAACSSTKGEAKDVESASSHGVDGNEDRPRSDAEDERKADAERPITVDFVNRDLFTVLSFIALKSNFNLVVDGSIPRRVTVMYRDVSPREIIRRICGEHGLTLTEDGDSIVVRSPVNSSTACVFKGEVDGRWHVAFEKRAAAAAIGEFATLAKLTLLLPENLSQAEQEAPVSIYMRNATTIDVLERIADVLGWSVKKVDDGKDTSWAFTRE